jgi:hypothetical protein
MRTIIPAIVIVVLLCLCVRWQLNEWQDFRDAKRRISEAVAARAERSATQPTTQPEELPAEAQRD